MASTPIVTLVTGATRGIGAGIVSQLLQRPQNVVVATVRNFDSSPAQELVRKAKTNKKLIVLKIDSSRGGQEDARAAAKALREEYKVDHCDVIIANAGGATDLGPLVDVKMDDVRWNFEVNTFAPLALFQAFVPFLEKSSNPRILFISTAIASKGFQRALPYKSTTYGSSKAALNFIALRIAIEHPHITSIAVHPGLVSTELGTTAQTTIGKVMTESVAEGSAISVEQSATAILALADKATVKEYSGKFINAPEDSELPW